MVAGSRSIPCSRTLVLLHRHRDTAFGLFDGFHQLFRVLADIDDYALLVCR